MKTANKYKLYEVEDAAQALDQNSRENAGTFDTLLLLVFFLRKFLVVLAMLVPYYAR